MYRGYKTYPEDDRPPVWKMRISGVAIALARFKFRKVAPAYRQADTMTDDDTTLRQYISNVFLD